MLNFEQLNFSAVYITPGLPAAGINPPLENTSDQSPSFAQYLLAQGESPSVLSRSPFSAPLKKNTFKPAATPLPVLRLAERLSGFVEPAALLPQTTPATDKTARFDAIQLLWSSAAQPLQPLLSSQSSFEAPFFRMIAVDTSVAVADKVLSGEWPEGEVLPDAAPEPAPAGAVGSLEPAAEPGAVPVVSVSPVVPAVPTAAYDIAPAVPAAPVVVSDTDADAAPVTSAVPAAPVVVSDDADAAPAVPAAPVAVSGTDADAAPVTSAVPAAPVAVSDTDADAAPAVPAAPVVVSDDTDAAPVAPAVSTAPVAVSDTDADAAPVTPAVPGAPVAVSDDTDAAPVTPAVPAAPVAVSDADTDAAPVTPAVPAAPVAVSDDTDAAPVTPAVPAAPVAVSDDTDADAAPVTPAAPVVVSDTDADAAPVAPAVPAAPVAVSDDADAAAPVAPAVPAAPVAVSDDADAAPVAPAVPAAPVAVSDDADAAPVAPAVPAAPVAVSDDADAAPVAVSDDADAAPVAPAVPAAVSDDVPASPAAASGFESGLAVPAAAPVVSNPSSELASPDLIADREKSAVSVMNDAVSIIGSSEQVFQSTAAEAELAVNPEMPPVNAAPALPRFAPAADMAAETDDLPVVAPVNAPSPQTEDTTADADTNAQPQFAQTAESVPAPQESEENVLSIAQIAWGQVLVATRSTLEPGKTEQKQQRAKAAMPLASRSVWSEVSILSGAAAQAAEAPAYAVLSTQAQRLQQQFQKAVDRPVQKGFAAALSSLPLTFSTQPPQPLLVRNAFNSAPTDLKPSVPLHQPAEAAALLRSSLVQQPAPAAAQTPLPAEMRVKSSAPVTASVAAPASQDAADTGTLQQPVMLSAAQVIQAVNQNIPIHVANFPAFVNQVIQTQGARLNVVQSIDVTLQPAHLGQVTAQFQLTKQNQVVISLYTQSLVTAKTLESYVQEIQQIVGKTQFSLSAVTIKHAVAPARSAGGSGQTSTGQQQGEFSARQSGSRRGGQRRRRQGEDLSIDGVSV